MRDLAVLLHHGHVLVDRVSGEQFVGTLSTKNDLYLSRGIMDKKYKGIAAASLTGSSMWVTKPGRKLRKSSGLKISS